MAACILNVTLNGGEWPTSQFGGCTYCALSAEGQNWEAIRQSLLGNDSANKLIARQWLSSHHVIAATDTPATIAELLEVVISVKSAMMAASLCNIAAARKDVFCGVCPEAISGELKPMVSRAIRQ
jgi:hypothetical protein